MDMRFVVQFVSVHIKVIRFFRLNVQHIWLVISFSISSILFINELYNSYLVWWHFFETFEVAEP